MYQPSRPTTRRRQAGAVGEHLGRGMDVRHHLGPVRRAGRPRRPGRRAGSPGSPAAWTALQRRAVGGGRRSDVQAECAAAVQQRLGAGRDLEIRRGRCRAAGRIAGAWRSCDGVPENLIRLPATVSGSAHGKARTRHARGGRALSLGASVRSGSWRCLGWRDGAGFPAAVIAAFGDGRRSAPGSAAGADERGAGAGPGRRAQARRHAQHAAHARTAAC